MFNSTITQCLHFYLAIQHVQEGAAHLVAIQVYFVNCGEMQSQFVEERVHFFFVFFNVSIIFIGMICVCVIGSV